MATSRPPGATSGAAPPSRRSACARQAADLALADPPLELRVPAQRARAGARQVEDDAVEGAGEGRRAGVGDEQRQAAAQAAQVGAQHAGARQRRRRPSRTRTRGSAGEQREALAARRRGGVEHALAGRAAAAPAPPPGSPRPGRRNRRGAKAAVASGLPRRTVRPSGESAAGSTSSPSSISASASSSRPPRSRKARSCIGFGRLLAASRSRVRAVAEARRASARRGSRDGSSRSPAAAPGRRPATGQAVERAAPARCARSTPLTKLAPPRWVSWCACSTASWTAACAGTRSRNRSW